VFETFSGKARTFVWTGSTYSKVVKGRITTAEAHLNKFLQAFISPAAQPYGIYTHFSCR